MCKEICQKLYVGENAVYLVGPDKIPTYLTIFLEKMKRQAEEFKINQVRQLRTSTLRFLELCNQVPYSIFTYLKNAYSSKIEQLVITSDSQYNTFKIEDDEQKKHHLRMFRPNLENPANKEDTAKLN